MTHEDNTIAYGFCHCGCGEKTSLISMTNRSRGRIKGEPNRFVNGHNQATSPVHYTVEDRGYETPCWVWQRCIQLGYGKLWDGKSSRMAHDVYYERFIGPIPDGHDLHHKCKTRACVRPDHLDPLTRPAHSRLEQAKLSIEQVREIRILAKTHSCAEVGRMFGINRKTVLQIKDGTKWKGAN